MEGDREGSALYIDSQFMPSKLGKIRSHVCSVRRYAFTVSDKSSPRGQCSDLNRTCMRSVVVLGVADSDSRAIYT